MFGGSFQLPTILSELSSMIGFDYCALEAVVRVRAGGERVALFEKHPPPPKKKWKTHLHVVRKLTS